MKPTPEYIISVIKEQGVIPLFYDEDTNVSIAVVDALYTAGIRIVEYTNRGGKALDNFKTLLQQREKRWPQLLISDGTIKSAEAAKQFAEAGADFVICPGVVPEVAKVLQETETFWIPGCMTSTEIIIAEQHGAKLIKIFPGSLLGPSYITALKEIFFELMFMPTGGVEVSEENISAWFKAGVTAVGLGSKIISKEVLRKKDYTSIQHAAENALMLVKKIKPEIHKANN